MEKTIILAALLMTGCASMINGTTQSVHVVAEKITEPTECSLSNEEGEWISKLNSFTTEPVKIHRDGNPMSVKCENSTQIGSASTEPDFKTSLLLIDLLLVDTCIISCIIDGANNAFYEYPDTITVPMRAK